MTDLQHTPATSSDSSGEDAVSILDILQTIADNLKLLVLGPLAAGLIAIGITYLITPTFTATTRFLPPQQQQSSVAVMLQSLGALGGLAGAASGLKNPADQYIGFLQSRSVQDRLIERFDLMTRYDAKTKTDARQALKEKTRATSGKDGLIVLDADDKDPAFAAQLANAYLEELQQLLGRLSVTEAQQRRAFFERQLALAKDNLVRAEQALRATGVNTADLKSNPQSVISTVAQLQAQIRVQEVKITTMRGYLTESAPEFRMAVNEMAALRAQLKKAESASPTPSDKDPNYLGRYREFKYQEALLELFSKQYEIARVDEAREGAMIQVVDVAVTPERKSKPKRATIAILATIAALVALLLMVFMRQAVSAAARAPDTSEKFRRLRESLKVRGGEPT